MVKGTVRDDHLVNRCVRLESEQASRLGWETEHRQDPSSRKTFAQFFLNIAIIFHDLGYMVGELFAAVSLYLVALTCRERGVEA